MATTFPLSSVIVLTVLTTVLLVLLALLIWVIPIKQTKTKFTSCAIDLGCPARHPNAMAEAQMLSYMGNN